MAFLNSDVFWMGIFIGFAAALCIFVPLTVALVRVERQEATRLKKEMEAYFGQSV